MTLLPVYFVRISQPLLWEVQRQAGHKKYLNQQLSKLFQDEELNPLDIDATSKQLYLLLKNRSAQFFQLLINCNVNLSIQNETLYQLLLQNITQYLCIELGSRYCLDEMLRRNKSSLFLSSLRTHFVPGLWRGLLHFFLGMCQANGQMNQTIPCSSYSKTPKQRGDQFPCRHLLQSCEKGYAQCRLPHEGRSQDCSHPSIWPKDQCYEESQYSRLESKQCQRARYKGKSSFVIQQIDYQSLDYP